MSNQHTAIPEISRVSPFMVHETIQIMGENLADCRVYAWQSDDENESPETNPEKTACLTIEKAAAQALFARAENSGVTLLWLENERTGAKSEVFTANLPELWSQSMDAVLPGERLQLYGQNLILETITTEGKDMHRRDGSKTGLPRIFLQNTQNGQITQALWGLANDQDMPNQNRHKAEVIIPGDTPPGVYTVRLHNGTGGAYGFSGARTLTVKPSYDLIEYRAKAWNHYGVDIHGQVLKEVPVITVPCPKAQDLADAGEAIQRALDAMAAMGGGVVQLEPGRYGITRTLEIPPEVILRGCGDESTVIAVAVGKRLESYWPPMVSARRKGVDRRWAYGFEQMFKNKMKHTPMVWMKTRAGLEGLAILAGPGTGCLCAVGNTTADPCEFVFFNGVKGEYLNNPHLLKDADWIAQYHGILLLSKSYGFTMWNCRVKATMPLDMLPSRHDKAVLLGNTFETSPRQGTINTFLGSLYGSLVAENSFVHGKRSMMSQMGFEGNWIFQNRSLGVSRATNGQEEYMSEFGDSSWCGRATAIDGARITIPELTGDYPLVYGGVISENFRELPHYLYVASGRGIGQYRRVETIENGTVRLAEAFRVAPDSSSELALMNMTRHCLWVNNTSENGGGLNQFMFGAGLDNIIAGHEMISSGGISMWAFPYTRDADGKLVKYGVIGFNQIIGTINRFSSNQNAGIILWSKTGKLKDYTGTPLTIIGNIIRGNIVAGNAEGLLLKNQTFRYWMMENQPWLNYQPGHVAGVEINGDYNLVEQNLIVGVPTGVYQRGEYAGNVIADNRTEYVERALVREAE